MKVTVIGSGYVGLVTAACLADMGNSVYCLDIDEAKIAMLEAGQMPIHEPGLAQVVHANVQAGRLRFGTDTQEAALHAKVQFIAVGTPPDSDGSADLQYVLAAARELGRRMDGYRVVVDKSTVPVGTARAVRAAIAEELKTRGVDHRFSVVSNPEFLKEGAAVEDFMRPDRIVIGSDDEEATEVLRQLYAPFERNHSKFMGMDVASAELTKYAANAMLATRISFMNEMAMLAGALGADIDAVRRGIGSDRRIGSFKPGTDDMREAPSQAVVREPARRGAKVRAYDPVAAAEGRRVLADVDGLAFVESAMDALRDADALVIVTEWKEFRSVDLDAMRALMRRAVIVDGRNIVDPRAARAAGFDYSGIGRPRPTLSTQPEPR